MSLYLVDIDSATIFDSHKDIELSIPIIVKVNKVFCQFFNDTADSIEEKLDFLDEVADAITYAEDEDLILENIKKILQKVGKKV